MKTRCIEKKLAMICFFLFLCLGVWSETAQAATAASGSCGSRLTWTLSDTGTLTISGTGEMTSYPWSSCGTDVNVIVIKSGVTSICEKAFYGLEAYSVSIPSTVTSIGEWAFANTRLTTVTIPDGVTEIGAWTFYNCEYLTSITFPDSVTSIGEHALRQCSRLTQIVLPASLTSLGRWTFARDYSLKTVVFTGSRPDFGSEVFYADTVTAYYPASDSSWKGISSSLGGTVTWKSYSSRSAISLDTIDTSGDFVIEDGELVLYRGTGGSVTIPGTVKKIGGGAFRNCLAVTSVTIPSGVKSIGSSAFSGCANLKSVSISKGLTLVGTYAFSDCTALTSVTLPSSVTGLGERAFSGCTALTSFQAGSGLTYIGDLAFNNCSKLKTFELSNTEISLGVNVFLNCSKLDTTLTENLESAAKQAGPIYDYEIFLVNKYDTLYTDNSSVAAILYVKTDNPTSGNISLGFSSGEWTSYSAPTSLMSGNSSYPDVEEEEDLLSISNVLKVEGGYIFEYTPEKAGTYTISVRESSAGQMVETGTSIKLTFVDYEQAYTDWLDSVISEYTTSSMTPEEKFDAIVANAFNDWRYPEMVQVNGEWDVVSFLGEKGTIWERKRFDSAVSPEVLIAIGERVGYTVTWAGEDDYANHACVYKQDGTMVTVCPGTSTGYVTDITYMDFSVYSHSYGAGKVTKEATSTAAGIRTYTCKDCGATKGEKLAKLGTTVTSEKVSYTVTSSGSSRKVACAGITSSSATSVTIPSAIRIDGLTYKVTSIAEGAFKNRTKLKSVTISSSVSSIGEKAFYGCTSLTTVKIPSGVKTIGTAAFAKCTALKSVTGCASVTTVKAKAFYGDTKLTKVSGMTKVTKIGSKAFYNCMKLTQVGSKSSRVTLAKVKTIGASAFYGCKALTYVNLSSTALTSLGEKSFANCTKLATFVSKSAKLAGIGKKAFYGDKKLASVTLKTSKLTSSNVKTDAFKGIKSTCTFKVPSKKVSSYKKIFKARGAGSKITVKKAQ